LRCPQRLDPGTTGLGSTVDCASEIEGALSYLLHPLALVNSAPLLISISL